MAHGQGADTNPKTPIFDQPWSPIPEISSLYSILGIMSSTQAPPRGMNDDKITLPHLTADRSQASEE